jgi:putative thioredoxin
MTSNYIVEVNEADFEYEVLAHSQKVPVVVDFWAEWCGPCRMLGPTLERLADEAGGEFRLAKVDVDENPSLAMRYNVSGIPAVKGFRNGQVVAEFVGAQPEPQVRDFLRKLVPSPEDLQQEKAMSLLEQQRWVDAEEVLRSVLDRRSESAGAKLGLAKALLAQGKGQESLFLLDQIPGGREFQDAEILRPLASTLISLDENFVESEDYLDAAYQRVFKLVKNGNLPAAIDGLLEILRKDKHYRDEEARKVALSLLGLLGEGNPMTRQYRNELASILF